MCLLNPAVVPRCARGSATVRSAVDVTRLHAMRGVGALQGTHPGSKAWPPSSCWRVKVLLACFSFRLAWPIRLLECRWLPVGLCRLKIPLSTDLCGLSR